MLTNHNGPASVFNVHHVLLLSNMFRFSGFFCFFYLKAKLTQLIRKTSIARQNTPRRAYIPISRSDRPLVGWVSSLFPVPGTSTGAG